MTLLAEETNITDDHVTERVSELSPQMVVPKEFQERYTERLAAWSTSIDPYDEFQRFHLGQAVLASIRVENCQAAEIKRKVVLADIATDPGRRWVRNREYEVKQIASSLKRNPVKIQSELERTFTGREWLLAKWNLLALAVPTEGESRWTEELTQEVFDLKGVAKAYRPAMIASCNVFLDTKATRELILSEIAKLTELQEDLASENAELRELHRQGIGLENDVNLKFIKRSEADAQRMLTRSLKIVKQAKAVKTPSQAKPTAPEVAPVVAAPVVKVTPAPKTETPVGNRHYRRKQEATARREAHRARQKV